MARWIITEWDGNNAQSQHELPGNYTEAEIERILQRLVCRTLSTVEIIRSSYRSNDPDRIDLLDPVSQHRPIDYGRGGLHFTADYEG